MGYHHLASTEAYLEPIPECDRTLGGSEEIYRKLFIESMDAIFIGDARTGIIIDCNRAACELVGREKSELVGQHQSILHPASERIDGTMTRTFLQHMTDKEGEVLEAQVVTKTREIRDVAIKANIIEIRENLYVQGIFRDVTDWKRYEGQMRALHISADKLAVTKSVEEIYDIILDIIRSVLGFEFLGIAVREGESVHYVKALGIDIPPDFRAPIDKSIAGRAFLTGSTQLINDAKIDPDYHVVEVDASIPSMRSELAIPIVVDTKVELVINIESTKLNAFTRRDKDMLDAFADRIAASIKIIRHEEELQHYIEELMRSNRDLDEYTYVVSHDLKAPLRTIRSFSYLLLKDLGDEISEEGRDYLHRIANAAINMDALIEDLLLLSRVGRKFTNVEEVDLNQLLREIEGDLKPIIAQRKARVVVNELPVVHVPKTWMKQLLTNLIDNGIKFNKSEVPTVEVRFESRNDDYMFAVRDNGIGIPEQYFDKIFKLFERLHPREEYEGTGAGLAICKKIVDYFGGQIWFESRLGEGSTFFFTIPSSPKLGEV